MVKIMVVDDEPDIVYIVGEMLKKNGYEVVGATSGEEALKKIRQEKPDLILLDIMMPGIDGWETCKRIKEGKDTRGILVAMLTVMDSDINKEKSFQFSGADAHITKPIIEHKILNTIEWLLKNKARKKVGKRGQG
jgi:two-component system alkaline phosphatase synthesis response regulator PhoP